MFGTGQGSIHLFRIKVNRRLIFNWTWFLERCSKYRLPEGQIQVLIIWNVIEYLALFAIVLTHEFGHALACRSVGGTADKIMLWPLGGVAYVNPPQRPGATLWSIAAGPLVNVVLAIPLALAFWTARSLDSACFESRRISADLSQSSSPTYVLLVFNILPIYPLDGGQILRSLLWYPLGRARSLLVASSLGFFGVAGLIALALWTQSIWTGLIAAYAGMNCWSGFKTARALRNLEKIPRRAGFACPSCRTAPPIGPIWRCNKCDTSFDTFETGGVCPQCSARFEKTTCLDCRQQAPVSEWQAGYVPGVGVMSGEATTK